MKTTLATNTNQILISHLIEFKKYLLLPLYQCNIHMTANTQDLIFGRFQNILIHFHVTNCRAHVNATIAKKLITLSYVSFD